MAASNMAIRIAQVSEGASLGPDGAGPTLQIHTWVDDRLDLPVTGTHFGFVWTGQAYLMRDQSLATFPLTAGMYFSLAEAATVGGPASAGIVITALTHEGRFLLGGPIENDRRFPYIDGGETSVLVAPVVVGDPVLNALYMPPNVNQTVHHHPSDRIGMIIRGSGECCGGGDCHPLTPGTLFHIPAHQTHKFVTHGQGLDLVVFHPDSDMGFSDRAHPMLSRTLINQVSAMNLPDIQTPSLS